MNFFGISHKAYLKGSDGDRRNHGVNVCPVSNPNQTGPNGITEKEGEVPANDGAHVRVMTKAGEPDGRREGPTKGVCRVVVNVKEKVTCAIC